MAWTQDQLDALDAAIANGTLSVEYADKKVTYRSLDEMLKIRAAMQKALGQTTRSTRIQMIVDKGHDEC
jgi:hypothetical protein